MKEFSIPVTWEVWDKVKVKANSIEEAIQYVKDNIDTIPLGTEPKYIDGSYKIDDGGNGEATIDETIKYLKEYWNLSNGIDGEEIKILTMKQEDKDELIQKFNSKEKCDAYRKKLDSFEFLMYWKDSGGVIIRESQMHDSIGTEQIYSTIQLCDMMGSDGFDNEHHVYKFMVLLYEDKNVVNVIHTDTICDAIEAYENVLQQIQQQE